MFMNVWAHRRQLAGKTMTLLTAATLLLTVAESRAESGFYVGGSLGDAAVDVDVTDQVDNFNFDENDFGWKVFGGYNFDVTAFDLAVEASYVDLGAPSGDVAGNILEFDTTAFDLFGVAGVELGPVGVFAKAGLVAWDTDSSIDDVSLSDDGTDPAYGVGVDFAMGSLEFRAEYEWFDIESTDDVGLLSAGIVFIF